MGGSRAMTFASAAPSASASTSRTTRRRSSCWSARVRAWLPCSASPATPEGAVLDWGALYLREELSRLAEQAPQLRIHHCVLRSATQHEHEGQLDELAVRLAGPLASVRAFLCGDGEIVHKLRRKLFLAGMPSAEILADPFLPAPA